MDGNYDVTTFTSQYLYFKKAWSSQFVEIIKIVTIFIRTIFKDPNKVAITENYVSKCNLYFFLDIAKFADFR